MVKFVYFDVGGVVIKDFSGTNKWEELRRSIGITPKQDTRFDEIFNKYEPEVCIGSDIELLVPILEKEFDLKLPSSYSLLADFVDRFEVNKSIWPTLKYAKENYKIGLLTNMYPKMLDAIYKRNLIPDIKFDQIVDSSIEKVRKPQKEIFRLAQKRCGFNANEILFIDNGQKHVDSAKEFGWNTFFYDSSNVEKSSSQLMESIK